MSLLPAPIVKNSHIFAGIYLIILYTKLERQYQIWTSVKRPGKLLSRRTNFSALLQITYSNFRLKLC